MPIYVHLRHLEGYIVVIVVIVVVDDVAVVVVVVLTKCLGVILVFYSTPERMTMFLIIPYLETSLLSCCVPLQQVLLLREHKAEVGTHPHGGGGGAIDTTGSQWGGLLYVIEYNTEQVLGVQYTSRCTHVHTH